MGYANKKNNDKRWLITVIVGIAGIPHILAMTLEKLYLTLYRLLL